MAERNIKILVRDKRAQVEGSPVIICGNSDYTITFDFDDEWTEGGARTARFVYVKGGKVQHEDVVFLADTVGVPVLSDVAFVHVGVFAGDLCTTTPARINCRKSILCGSGEVHEPTPDVYAQIMAFFDQVAGRLTASEQTLETHGEQIAENTQAIEAVAESVSGLREDFDGHKHLAADIEDFPEAMPPTEHDHSAADITAGELAGAVKANASAVADLAVSQVRNIYAGTAELESGVSALPPGDLYFQYE